jgi:hypothetical protein
MTPISEAKAERLKEYRITLIATGKSWTTHEKPSVGGEIGILVVTDIGTKTQIHVPRSAVWWCEDMPY